MAENQIGQNYKKIILYSLIGCAVLVGILLFFVIKNREFIRVLGKVFYRQASNCETNIISNSPKKIIGITSPYIYISLEKNQLYFNNKIYNIGVGKPETPSPRGIGFIYEKRDKILFEYSQGELKGKSILFYTDDKGMRKKMPYEILRALGIYINGSKAYSIHSTTETNSIGRFVSHGCIRMRIGDMLELFPRVEANTLVIIE